MSVNRLHKLKVLQKKYLMTYAGSGNGLHGELRDGFLHEIGHLVCMGVTAEEFYHDADRRYSALEVFVGKRIRQFAKDGGNADNDECRTIAACVHAFRQLRMMHNTKLFVKSALVLAHDLMNDPESAPGKVQRSLPTKVARQRGQKILKFVDELYELETKD